MLNKYIILLINKIANYFSAYFQTLWHNVYDKFYFNKTYISVNIFEKN